MRRAKKGSRAVTKPPPRELPSRPSAKGRLRIRLLVGYLRLVYRPIVRGAARAALEGREVERGVPQQGRWLRSDVNCFLRAVWKEVDALLPEARLDELPTIGNRHNVFLAVITTAAYRKLREAGVGGPYARELIGDVGWKVYARMLGIVSAPFRLITRDRQRRMALTLRALMIFPFSAPGAPGYEVRAWASAEGFHTHWTHCPPEAFARRLSAEHRTDDLEAFYHSWCLYDWAAADMLVGDGRRGHYTRPKTLSRGDAVCDMCWFARLPPDSSRAEHSPPGQKS